MERAINETRAHSRRPPFTVAAILGFDKRKGIARCELANGQQANVELRGFGPSDPCWRGLSDAELVNLWRQYRATRA